MKIREIFILLFGDPIVNVKLGKSYLLMNLSHLRPIHWTEFENYDRALPRICKNIVSFNLNKSDDLVVVDVGANIGDSIFTILDEVSANFLAIEPDPKFFDLLEKNVKKNDQKIVLDRSLLGNKNKSINMVLSTSSSTALLKKSTQKSKIFKLDTLIDKHNFDPIDLIKIDTDGFEFDILLGSEKTLISQKPFIFFEFIPENLIKNGRSPFLLFKYLNKLGYDEGIFYDNFGKNPKLIKLSHTNVLKLVKKIDNKNIYYFDVFTFHKSLKNKVSKMIDIELGVC